MNWVVHQNITIHQLRVNSVSQASIFQIGSAGKVSSLANVFNYHGYEPGAFDTGPVYPEEPPGTLVPLPSLSS